MNNEQKNNVPEQGNEALVQEDNLLFEQAKAFLLSQHFILTAHDYALSFFSSFGNEDGIVFLISKMPSQKISLSCNAHKGAPIKHLLSPCIIEDISFLKQFFNGNEVIQNYFKYTNHE